MDSFPKTKKNLRKSGKFILENGTSGSGIWSQSFRLGASEKFLGFSNFSDIFVHKLMVASNAFLIMKNEKYDVVSFTSEVKTKKTIEIVIIMM